MDEQLNVSILPRKDDTLQNKIGKWTGMIGFTLLPLNALGWLIIHSSRLFWEIGVGGLMLIMIGIFLNFEGKNPSKPESSP